MAGMADAFPGENQRAMGSMAGIAGIAADSNVQVARAEGVGTAEPQPTQRALGELEHMVQSAHLCASALEEALGFVLAPEAAEVMKPAGPADDYYGTSPSTRALHALTDDVQRLCSRLTSMKQRLEI